jgi:hypothetical protein
MTKLRTNRHAVTTSTPPPLQDLSRTSAYGELAKSVADLQQSGCARLSASLNQRRNLRHVCQLEGAQVQIWGKFRLAILNQKVVLPLSHSWYRQD